MKAGTRILYPEEVEWWDADILQISVYNGMDRNLEIMRSSAQKCRESGARFVIHPVGYSLFNGETIDDLKEMAEMTDIALILHDERSDEGGRISGQHVKRFRDVLDGLKAVSDISFENAVNTADVKWFWNNFAESVTLDIGHVESAGLDSVEFVRSLDHGIIDKLQFVHMHRNNGLRGGITDHWPLIPDCMELRALRELLNLKSDISVILEINELEIIGESLKLLRELS
jgi:sugar phosphate isomerase/epimerase